MILFYYIILYNFKAASLIIIINHVHFKLRLIDFLANNKQFTISVQKQELRALLHFFCLNGKCRDDVGKPWILQINVK